ncbi:hypothetical protein ACM66B_002780 [Microbotryomycetes sp. NB124-2]
MTTTADPPAPGGVPVPADLRASQTSSGSSSKQQLPAAWHLASGALSGAASVLALQPLDLIKTRVQQDQHQSLTSSTRDGPRSKAQRRIVYTARTVIAQDGVTGLWRGTVPTLYRNVPGVSMYFLTLSRLRTFVGRFSAFRAKSITASTNNKIKLTPAGDLIVGSTARTGVGFILMPFTLLKTLSESSLHHGKPLSTFGAFKELYGQGGIKSLWRGAVPTALRDAPNAGLFIVFYERGRRLLGVRGDAGGGAVGGGAAGATASLISTLLTTPFDLIKTRRQISPDVYTSMKESVRLVYKESGVFGFWQGGGLRVVRKAGSAGIGWAVYEAVVGVGERRRTAAAVATRRD